MVTRSSMPIVKQLFQNPSFQRQTAKRAAASVASSSQSPLFRPSLGGVRPISSVVSNHLTPMLGRSSTPTAADPLREPQRSFHSATFANLPRIDLTKCTSRENLGSRRSHSVSSVADPQQIQHLTTLLNELRAFTGPSDVTGLSDDELLPHLGSDPDLQQAITEAHRLAFNPDLSKPDEKELNRLMQLPEAEAIEACQVGLVNFYPEENLSPCLNIAAQGGWVVSSKGVHYDVASYGKDPLGHNPPAILAAISQPTVSKNMMYANVQQKLLHQHLAKALNVEPDEVRYQIGNTGSDGVELMLVHIDAYAKQLMQSGKLTLNKTDKADDNTEEKPRILVLAKGFHGRTRRPAELSDSTQPKYQSAFVNSRTTYDVTAIPVNDVEALRATCQQAREEGRPFVAMIAEPIQGEGNPGIALSPEFWEAAVSESTAQAEDPNTAFRFMLCSDSVQAGGWRAGDFSLLVRPEYRASGRPDFEVFSKAIGGSREAVSILAMKTEVSDCFKQGTYGNTRAGNPHGLAVVNAMFDQMTPEVKQNIHDRSEQLLNGFHRLHQRYPQLIQSAQGTGLLLALKINTDIVPVVGEGGLEPMLRQQGLDIIHGGGDRYLRLTPNYLMTEQQADLVIHKIESVVRQVLGLDRYNPGTTFGPDYLDIMLRPLTFKPFQDPQFLQRMDQSRTTALASLQAGEWHQNPLCSVIDGQRYDHGLPEPTYAALSREPVGSKIVLAEPHFQTWKSAFTAKAQQRLTLDPETLQKLSDVVEAFREAQNEPEHNGKVLAHLSYDFETDKTAEIDERVDTGVRAKAFDAEVRESLLNGKLDYNVSAAGIVISPVVNFGSLLDVQQKAMHAIGTGVPVTWLVRSGEAAQQSTREVMMLQERLIEAGLGEWLNIVVLNDSQRDQLFDEAGVTTLLTGRSSSAVAVQSKAPDSSTSGSGSSGDFALDPAISTSPKFAQRLREDATVATNGRQCTALQGGSVNVDLNSPAHQAFVDNILFEGAVPQTPLESAEQQYQQKVWHGAYASPEAKLPDDVKVLTKGQGLVVYETDQQFLGEQYTWGVNSIGLHNNEGRIENLTALLKAHDWLSIGYIANTDNLAEEVDHFVAALNASKATVGTLSGDGEAGCVFSAPQNPGEIFAERTQHKIGKVVVSHSPRHAPVPKGTALWGPSASYLAQRPNRFDAADRAAEKALVQDLSLSADEVGYLNELNDFLSNNIGPKAIDRSDRGPTVEGFSYRSSDERTTLFMPETCYSLKSTIKPVDLAARLLLIANTTMKHNLDAVMVHPAHQALVPAIERYLEAKGLAVPVSVASDPNTATTDEVEPVNATRIRDVFKMPDDVVGMAGCRMMHAKFLGAPSDPNTKSIFIDKVSDGVGWLKREV